MTDLEIEQGGEHYLAQIVEILLRQCRETALRGGRENKVTSTHTHQLVRRVLVETFSRFRKVSTLNKPSSNRAICTKT